jgi:chemotaxis signal transduction protein
MTQDHATGTDRVQALRDAFDSTFSLAPPTAGDPPEDLLAIGVGQAPYALRLSEITGLYASKPVTRLPGTSPELLGIAGFRGAIVAVYDLRVLLGAAATEPSRWLVLASPDSTVGFAFDRFEGHLRVSRNAIATHAGGEGTRLDVQETIQLADVVRPIVSVPALLEAINVTKESQEKES